MWQPEDPLSAESLRPVHEINERCLQLLAGAAQDPKESGLELATQLKDVLSGLTPEARRRAAERVFLLVDFEFRNVEWWRRALDASARPSRTGDWQGGFARRDAVPLARATLTLAWHTARSDSVATPVLLGLSTDVAAVVATLQLADIDRIAEAQFRALRPRWEDRPAVWRRLLLAARAGDAAAMRDFTLHGLQLMAGDLIPG